MKKKLIGLALIAGAVAAAAKLVAAKKTEWEGLTESEAREKVEQGLPSRVPEEKRAEVADKVVTKMRERGVLAEDAAELTPEPVSGDGEVTEEEPVAEAEASDEPSDEDQPSG